MKAKIAISFFSSMLVFLLTFWTAGYSPYAANLVESISFFVLTYIILQKYASPSTYGFPFVIAIVVGRLILELPIRIADFPETIFTLFTTLVALSSILLAALNYKEKNWSVLALTVIVLVLMSTVAQAEWLLAFRHGN